MKADLKNIISRTLAEALKEGSIKTRVEVALERPKKEAFGDFSTNVAMLLSPLEGRPPRELASILMPKIASSPGISRCEVAGPGFINIFLDRSYWHALLGEIIKKGSSYGDSDIGKGKKVQIEFVSANPTGPLHIGHGRGAAVGDSLSNILKTAGFDVIKEYYINDVGRQMHILGESLIFRYLELLGEKNEPPEDFYRGEYLKEIAQGFLEKYGKGYRDNAKNPDAETYAFFSAFASNAVLSGIKKDLNDFGVGFDVWYSEKTLYNRNLVINTIDELKEKKLLYEKDDALWFKTTDLGDDKDRVLIKADGSFTYFASDIAYHREKTERGFSTIVDIWGADHHGYEARIKALFKALDYDEDSLKIIFIQLVSLLRHGEPVPMGKREGEFVTLRQVLDEVGRSACRFFFLMRKPDSQMGFDLEVAKKQAPENPVYYVQYSYARIMSIMEFANEKGIAIEDPPSINILRKLELKEELDIIRHMAAFEETIEKAALEMEPHRITFYLQELAGLFHPYYNRNRVVTEDGELTLARLFLCKALAGVIKKGLMLLGVEAPAKM